MSDLKHALDQCVGDAAILLGRTNAKGLHFPIGKTVDDFDREIRRRLRNVDPDLRAYLVSLDTNERGNSDLYKFLAMSGPNKHQRIAGVSAKSGMLINGKNLGVISGAVTLNIGKWHRRQNEIEFVRLGRGSRLIGKGEFYDVLKPVLRVIFKDGKPPFDESLPAVLRRFCSECESVLTGIEAETERILRARP